MRLYYKEFLIRDWQPADRAIAFELIGQVLAEYGLVQEPTGADRDVWEVEQFYAQGAFWIIERAGTIVGTGAFYPIKRGDNAVEIRKMYLLPAARGHGLGRFLLGQLEQAVREKGFTQIWIETASVLKQAVQLYETSGYQPASGVETERCDRVYCKTLYP
jgi:putative acetyltransferase